MQNASMSTLPPFAVYTFWARQTATARRLEWRACPTLAAAGASVVAAAGTASAVVAQQTSEPKLNFPTLEFCSVRVAHKAGTAT